MRAHKLLIDPVDNALLDSTGRRLAGQPLRSPPTATVVVGFVQPHKPVVVSSSPSAHTAGAASAGAASAGAASAGPVSASSSPSAHTAGAASAGAASAGAASAGPVSAAGGQAASAAADVKLPSGLSAAALSAARPAGQQNPAQMKAACWASFRRWCALQSGCGRSAMMSSTTSSHVGRPSPPNSGSWMARSWRRRRLNLSSLKKTTSFSVPHLPGPAPYTW